MSDIIGGVAQLLGTGINAIATGSQNKKSRRWQEKMYYQQVGDNLRFWQMQNEYNDPSAQMERLRGAGLNPNLVYGNGSVANTAEGISAPKPGNPQFNVPDFSGLSSIFTTMADLDIKKEQANNLRSQNTVHLEEARLKRIQGDRAEFDLGLETELRDVSADFRRERLRSTSAQTDVLLNRDLREAMLNSSNLQEAAERILNSKMQRAKTAEEIQHIRAQRNYILNNIELQEFDRELRKMNVTIHDPYYMRLGARLLEPLMNTSDPAYELGKRTRKYFQDKFKK